MTPPPEVGGVLFAHCAEALTGFDELVGAYWDEEGGCLVLIGRPSGAQAEVAVGLPPMDRDLLFTALRAAIAGDHVGVSIDPPAEYRERAAGSSFPPDGTPMLVSYLGSTSGTLLGATMFEADRLLKCLSNGCYNDQARRPIERVPGFVPLVEMIRPTAGTGSGAWHRFWFVIDYVQLKRDATGTALAFGDVKLKVLAETEKDGGPAEHVDPVDARFADHLTEHYGDYAQVFPILARLEDAAKITAVAQYLVNTGAPVDLETLFCEPPVPVDTPDVTPGISVMSPNTVVTGATTHTVSLYGGVDFDVRVQVEQDEALTCRLRNHAQRSRSRAGERTWAFSVEGRRLRASAIGMRRPVPRRLRTCTDVRLAAATEGPGVALGRDYRPGALPGGEFGPGWALDLPYRLTILRRTTKRAEVLTTRERLNAPQQAILGLLLHDGSSGEWRHYHALSGHDGQPGDTFARVLSREREGNAFSFKYDPSDRLVRAGGGWCLRAGRADHYFDADGRPVSVREEGRASVRYEYADGRLVRVAGGDGGTLSVTYDPALPDRVSSLKAQDGQCVSYQYDPTGRLAAAIDCAGVVESYRYDECGRLIEIRGRSGLVVQRYAYGSRGELVTSHTSPIRDGRGNVVRRSFDTERRLLLVEDGAGGEVHYGYNTKGQLEEVRVVDTATARSWGMTYDAAERIVSLRASSGLAISFFYDRAGNMARVVSNRGEVFALHREDEGPVGRVESGTGGCWDVQYAEPGVVSGISASDGDHCHFEYSRTGLRRLTSNGAEVAIDKRSDAVTIRVRSAAGWRKELMYDLRGRLVMSRCLDRERLSYQYGAGDELTAVIDGNGSGVHYRTDNERLTVTLSFT